MNSHFHLMGASFYITRLSHRKLRQDRTWALWFILLLMCSESMLGYVLGSYFTGTSSGNQAYTTGTIKLINVINGVFGLFYKIAKYLRNETKNAICNDIKF